MTRTQTDPHGERAPHDTEHREYGRRHDQGVTQVKLLNSTRLTADYYDIHADGSSKAVVLQNGALCPTEDQTMPRAMGVDYAES